jgi:hypothetical protein
VSADKDLYNTQKNHSERPTGASKHQLSVSILDAGRPNRDENGRPSPQSFYALVSGSKRDTTGAKTRPQAIFPQAISWTKYAIKPTIHPTIAMPPLAATEPVNTNPISIIMKRPKTCQVQALTRSLILLSIGISP